MELTHRFTVPDRRRGDLGGVQRHRVGRRVLPGRRVTSVEGDTSRARCKVKLGPIALVYNGSGTFVEKDEAAHRFVVEAKGKDKRGNGTAGATVTATMTEAGRRHRRRGAHRPAITGKPAQFGRGVMQDVSDKLLGQFVACLEQRLTGPGVGRPAWRVAGRRRGSSRRPRLPEEGHHRPSARSPPMAGTSVPAAPATPHRLTPEAPAKDGAIASGSAPCCRCCVSVYHLSILRKKPPQWLAREEGVGYLLGLVRSRGSGAGKEEGGASVSGGCGLARRSTTTSAAPRRPTRRPRSRRTTRSSPSTTRGHGRPRDPHRRPPGLRQARDLPLLRRRTRATARPADPARHHGHPDGSRADRDAAREPGPLPGRAIGSADGHLSPGEHTYVITTGSTGCSGPATGRGDPVLLEPRSRAAGTGHRAVAAHRAPARAGR